MFIDVRLHTSSLIPSGVNRSSRQKHHALRRTIKYGNVRPHRRNTTHASSKEVASPMPDNLSGVWIRDSSASDMQAYDAMLGLMKLSGLQRTTALQLIEGLELEQTATELSVSFLTVVPFFKVTETFKFNGETTMSRRDLRAGVQTARIARLPKGGAYIEMTWPDPVAGRLSETYNPQGSVLTVSSQVLINGEEKGTKVIYRRRDAWEPRFQFPPGNFKLGPLSF